MSIRIIGAGITLGAGIGSFAYRVHREAKCLPEDQRGSLSQRMSEVLLASFIAAPEHHTKLVSTLSSAEATRANENQTTLRTSQSANDLLKQLQTSPNGSLPVFQATYSFPRPLDFNEERHTSFDVNFKAVGSSQSLESVKARQAIHRGNYLRCECLASKAAATGSREKREVIIAVTEEPPIEELCDILNEILRK